MSGYEPLVLIERMGIVAESDERDLGDAVWVRSPTMNLDANWTVCGADVIPGRGPLKRYGGEKIWALVWFVTG